jgi:hypothetical protein
VVYLWRLRRKARLRRAQPGPAVAA